MGKVVISKAWKISVLLLIAMALGATLECQFHLAGQADTHAATPEHRHGSSTHAAGDFHCLLAVLPLPGMFTAFLVSVLHTAPLLSQPTGLVFLPFVPPRSLVL